MKPSSFARFAVLLLACSVVGSTQAQDSILYISDTLRIVDDGVRSVVPFVKGTRKVGAAQSASFDIRFAGAWPTAAKQAFQEAANIWATHIQSEVLIEIDAEWAELEDDVLGSAGPYLLGVGNTWYPAALYNALVIRDVNQGSPDISATFNSSFDDWYYELDGRPPVDKYDFVSVVLHELGHGLGFTGSFDVKDGDPEVDECPGVGEGYGCWGISATSTSQVYPIVFDYYVEDASGTPLLEYQSPSIELANVLQSGQVFFNSEVARAYNGYIPVSLFTPTEFEPGSSLSHLDEDAFPAGSINALMTPDIRNGEAIHSPGSITCAMFQDIGWPLGEDCLQLIASPPPPPPVPTETETPLVAEYELDAFYPNPVASEAHATLRLRQGQYVTAEVYNTLGHRVAVVLDREVAANQEVTLDLAPAGWASGVYFVRISGETFAANHSVVVVGR